MRNAAYYSILLIGCLVGSTRAGVLFFDNDLTGFNTAVASYTLLGTEDFEESTLGDNMATAFAGPLSQSSTTPPYPNGILQPIEVSTSLGSLAAFNDTSEINTTAVIANSGEATLDWAFNASDNIIAVGLNPISFSGSVVTSSTISVFDTNDQPLGSIPVNADGEGSFHLGILATGLSRIGRINFQAVTVSGSPVSEGGDNAALYSAPVPEPASIFLAGMAWIGFRVLVRCRG